MHKIRFKGKIYTEVENDDNFLYDTSIVKEKYKVKNSKGELFTFIHSIIGYFLYDSKGNRYAEAQSIKEISR